MENLEKAILAAIQSAGKVPDSTQFAAEHKIDHLKVVGVIKSLETSEMIVVKVSHCVSTQKRAAQLTTSCLVALALIMHTPFMSIYLYQSQYKIDIVARQNQDTSRQLRSILNEGATGLLTLIIFVSSSHRFSYALR
jgi:hypothetical protein